MNQIREVDGNRTRFAVRSSAQARQMHVPGDDRSSSMAAVTSLRRWAPERIKWKDTSVRVSQVWGRWLQSINSSDGKLLVIDFWLNHKKRIPDRVKNKQTKRWWTNIEADDDTIIFLKRKKRRGTERLESHRNGDGEIRRKRVKIEFWEESVEGKATKHRWKIKMETWYKPWPRGMRIQEN